MIDAGGPRLTRFRLVLGVIFCFTASACTSTSQNLAVQPHVSDRIEKQPVLSLEKNLFEAFAQARTLVEAETQINLDSVTLKLANNQEIQNEVIRVTQRLVSTQFDEPRYIDYFLQRIVAEQEGSYAALYVDQQNRIFVSRPLLHAYIDTLENPSLKRPALLALMIHELVHAADDQVYGIHKNRTLSFKASFTQSATFEGHAQFLTRKICQKQRCLDGMQALDRFMFETTQDPDPVAQSVQAISRNVLEYSYIEGERFLTELAKRSNGASLIERVLRDPPDDPVQILVPETYPDLAREQRNRKLYAVLQPASHQWSVAPWKLVETSPIKGIDVRDNPDRRVAAVEGFTKLIVSMTGAQLYNQAVQSLSPVDIMLIEAENTSTARLFAESFVTRSTRSIRNRGGDSAATVHREESTGAQAYNLYSVTPGANSRAGTVSTVVAQSGPYVLQVSAQQSTGVRLLQDYARKVIGEIQ